MTRSQKLYCSDILDRILRIEAYTDAGQEAFRESKMRQDAVVFCFTIIGEAIKHLDDELIARQPHIDWRGFAGFRDILIHQYHNTEIEVAWQVSQDELPALKAAVTAMLKQLDESEPEP